MVDRSFIIPWIVCIIALRCFDIAECDSPWRNEDSSSCGAESKFSTPEECDRECKSGEPIKTCYYKFAVEWYSTAGPACASSINSPDCVLADNVSRSIMAVNRMMPGPTIKVCAGDKVVVDVENMVSGRQISIHWHGMYQQKTPYSDGVASVTQCAISEHTKFRYYFYTNAGTHWYHGHSGLEKMDGLRGTVIVKQPHSEDVNAKHYDEDEHHCMISDWDYELSEERFPGRTNNLGGVTGQNPDYILVDGMGRNLNPNSPLKHFKVSAGKRYRFRFVGAMGSTCPMMVTFQNHPLRCIATDGVSVEPSRLFDSFVINTGERYDMVLTADQKPDRYWIQVRGLVGCVATQLQQLAVLTYIEGEGEPSSPPPSYSPGLPRGKVLNPPSSPCDGSVEDETCVSELRNTHVPEDEGILADKPDVLLPVVFQLHQIAADEKDQGPYLIIGGNKFQFLLNGIMDMPAYGCMLADYERLSPYICNSGKKPAECKDAPACHCPHVEVVPMNAVVEMIIVHGDFSGTHQGLNHPFHFHGYCFYVADFGFLKNDSIEGMWDMIRSGRKEKLEHMSKKPICKDTIAVPPGGFAVLRFRATNPGIWLLHCHFEYHLRIHMRLDIVVGKREDWVKVPDGFPQCHDYLPTSVCTDEW